LKKALYLGPFEWIISFNLGLVHLSTAQYSSAFHYLSTSLHLRPNFANTYMYLGITLNKLGDFKNACSAFNKALEIEKDPTTYFNYAIVLYNGDMMEDARKMFDEGEKLFQELDAESKNAEPELVEHRTMLIKALNINIS